MDDLVVDEAALRRSQRTGWRSTTIRLHDDHEAFDHELWADEPPMKRLITAFEIAVTCAKMKGYDGDQLRLRRSVAQAQRRGSRM